MDNKMIGYYLSGNQHHESPVALSIPDIKKLPLIIASIRVSALFFRFPFSTVFNVPSISVTAESIDTHLVLKGVPARPLIGLFSINFFNELLAGRC